MSYEQATHLDAFNLLCGKLIGEGVHRNVFDCRIRDDLVVKVEKIDPMFRYMANYQEMKFWSENQYAEKVKRWLAPCVFLSPDCRILLMKKVNAIRPDERLPDQLPSFLTDIKRENFGWLDGKLVCIDYAMTIDNPNLRLRKASWE